MTQSFRLRHGIAGLLLLAALVSGVATCADVVALPDTQANIVPSHAARVFGERRKVEGIRNFGIVSPVLFRGGQPTRQGFKALAKMGVDIVVDARGDRSNSEGKEVRRLGMEYVSIPWHCPFPHDDVFVQFLKLLKDNPHKKIFVHCRLGDDRTGMMIAAYRMAVEGWSADDAMLELRYFGLTFDHHFICPRLAGYEHSFPQHLKRDPAFKELGLPANSAPTATK